MNNDYISNKSSVPASTTGTNNNTLPSPSSNLTNNTSHSIFQESAQASSHSHSSLPPVSYIIGEDSDEFLFGKDLDNWVEHENSIARQNGQNSNAAALKERILQIRALNRNGSDLSQLVVEGNITSLPKALAKLKLYTITVVAPQIQKIPYEIIWAWRDHDTRVYANLSLFENSLKLNHAYQEFDINQVSNTLERDRYFIRNEQKTKNYNQENDPIYGLSTQGLLSKMEEKKRIDNQIRGLVDEQFGDIKRDSD